MYLPQTKEWWLLFRLNQIYKMHWATQQQVSAYAYTKSKSMIILYKQKIKDETFERVYYSIWLWTLRHTWV